MKRWAAGLGSLAVVCLAAGNFTAAESQVDPAMMKANQALPLDKAWAACQQVLGAYRSHGAPTFARKGQFGLEQVPVAMADGPPSWPSGGRVHAGRAPQR